jgi:hypothetical protein
MNGFILLNKNEFWDYNTLSSISISQIFFGSVQKKLFQNQNPSIPKRKRAHPSESNQQKQSAS